MSAGMDVEMKKWMVTFLLEHAVMARLVAAWGLGETGEAAADDSTAVCKPRKADVAVLRAKIWRLSCPCMTFGEVFFFARGGWTSPGGIFLCNGGGSYA